MTLKVLDKKPNKLTWIVGLASKRTLNIAKRSRKYNFSYFDEDLFIDKKFEKRANNYLDYKKVHLHKYKRTKR